MPSRSLLACALACAASGALANPALTGSWHGTIDGTAIALTLDGRGGGQVDGRPIRYQVQGSALFIEDRGQLAIYQFELRGNQLLVAGGQLPGVLSMARGRAPARPAGSTAGVAAASNTTEALLGKWCKVTSFSANAGGGSQSSACFELRGNGTYVYGAESSMSAQAPGMWGGTSSSSGDAGRWSATANSLTASSSNGQVTTYRLEKRNHPRNRDPMLCLDGTCYVTYFRKNPW